MELAKSSGFIGFAVLFICLELFLINTTVAPNVNSKKVCIICGRKKAHAKNQPEGRENAGRFYEVNSNFEEIQNCFGVTHEGGVLCSTCKRAFDKHKKTGEKYDKLAGSKTQRPGRPKKRWKRRPPCKPRKRQEPDVEWQEEECNFGRIQRGPEGNVLVPGSVFDEIEKDIERLRKRCDIKEELTALKDAMHKKFILEKVAPIYDVREFRQFCISSGATTLFNTILTAVTSSRHSQKRTNLNEKRTMSILYKMCYCLSQQCNIMQVDHALYLRSSRINQEGFDTENQLGNTCCRRTVDHVLDALSTAHSQDLNCFILRAIENEWLLVLIIDDYTNIHTHRRPTGSKPTSANCMCTIVVKAFKQVKAVKLPHLNSELHDPEGVDITTCAQVMASTSQMSKLAKTYASTMPDWMVKQFFQPESERNRLSVHQYCEGASVRTMRKMDDLHLVDFIELQLKSKQNFKTAFDIVQGTNLKLYMQKYVLIQPGDWPCQFFSRQLVYENITNDETNLHDDSTQATMGEPDNPPPMAAVVPMMGPLHISINSREHVMLTFHPFFKNVYEYLFPHSKFPAKPKPWRISLLLEIVYAGWTLIRDTTRKAFHHCKDLQYGTLLNLLDNYLPLVLTIYAVTFKLNLFDEYFNAMVRIWVMFVCMKRRHYNKAPLVWIDTIIYWKKHFPEMHNLFQKWLTVSDEYPVENTHSIIRAQTQHSDTTTQLKNKVKAIFQSKTQQSNFRSHFTPPKHFSFSHGQLKYLKLKASTFLTDTLENITKNPSNTTLKYTKKGKLVSVHMPQLFKDATMKPSILPMSFLGDIPSKSNVKCDLPSCDVDDNSEEWSILPGCWHSFHNICLANMTHCPLCTEIIKQKIKELGEVAKAAILNSNTPPIENAEENDIPDDDEIDGNSPIIPCADSNDMSATLQATNSKISSFSPPQPLYNHDKPDITQDPTQPLPNMNKPPDCKSCSHTMNHHTSQEPNTLPCSSHNKQPSIRRPKFPPPQDDTQQNLPSFPVIKNTYPGDVTEWLLPSSLSQSQILGPTNLGSNACTVISVLEAIKLSSNMTFPSTTTELSNIINTFSSSMKEGNQLYNMFSMSPHQPNLEVKDVVAKLKTFNVNLHLTEDTGFFSVQDLLEKLQSLSYSAQQVTGVLIVAPDKAMLIFMKDGQFGVMDSHQHGEHGALLAVCSAGGVSDFVGYLSAMVHRYWNASLCGSNFTILAT